MKYKSGKATKSKYTPCLTKAEKTRLEKLAKAKRRVGLAIALAMISFTVYKTGISSSIIFGNSSYFASDEGNLFIYAKNFFTEKFSFLSDFGKAGSDFCFNYLKPPKKQSEAVYAQNAPENIATDEHSDSSASSGANPDHETEENPPEIKQDVFAPISPCNGKISSSFGTRIHPISGVTTNHNGIDIAANEGDEIYAIWNGVVEKAEYNDQSGNHVIIRHNDSTTSSYAHMSKLGVAKGDTVTTGDIIGYVGSTGMATGPHLHMEIRINKEPVNPEDYFSQG